MKVKTDNEKESENTIVSVNFLVKNWFSLLTIIILAIVGFIFTTQVERIDLLEKDSTSMKIDLAKTITQYQNILNMLDKLDTKIEKVDSKLDAKKK